MVGIYSGTCKPRPLEAYLESFISEISDLLTNGYFFNNIMYSFEIHSFICDTPARAFIKCTKSHTGYSSCDKCIVEGEYLGRMIFSGTTSPRRTDESFRLQIDEDHHKGISPLINLGVGMVTKFPIDYMHAVCLGVTKKLLNIWVSGNLSVRLSNQYVSQISERLELLKKYMPLEFNRKPRTLAEFRTFLVYVGPVVLENIVNLAVYEHFLLLHCAITIFLSSRHISVVGINIPSKFLDVFITHSVKIYGAEFLVHNVHALCHLEEEVKAYGPLDEISAFPFENYLGHLKRLVRSPVNPAAQIYRRIKEKSAYFNKTCHSILGNIQLALL